MTETPSCHVIIIPDCHAINVRAVYEDNYVSSENRESSEDRIIRENRESREGRIIRENRESREDRIIRENRKKTLHVLLVGVCVIVTIILILYFTKVGMGSSKLNVGILTNSTTIKKGHKNEIMLLHIK